MVSFHERLKEVRKLGDVTQKQVADGAQISENQYQSYEYGKHKPSIDTVIKLCLYLNVSADYLLGLSDEPLRR